MAQLKIYQPQIGPKEYSDVSSAGLMIPFSVATQQGAAISDLGKAVTDIYKDQKLQEDKNTVNKLLPGILYLYIMVKHINQISGKILSKL